MCRILVSGVEIHAKTVLLICTKTQESSEKQIVIFSTITLMCIRVNIFICTYYVEELYVCKAQADVLISVVFVSVHEPLFCANVCGLCN